MIGKVIPARAQGTELSILLALASSIAHALPGVAKNADAGWEGLPGWADDPGEFSAGSNDGERIGEEKERR